MIIQAIIFDFGGVLLNWNPHHLYQRYFPNDEAIDHFLKEIDFNTWNLEQDRGRSFAEAVTVLSAEFPHYNDLIRAYDEEWENSITGQINGTVEILKQLHGSGLSLYGLSNWSGEKFRLARPKFKFFDYFDDIIISGEIKLIKPDPAIYQFTLNQIGLTASECIFIDDSAKNVAVARELGFIGIHFESPEQLAAELRDLKLLNANLD